MALLMEKGDVSLRPMSLRPGGGVKNPFERFGKGAGFAVKQKAADIPIYEEEKKKPRSEVKQYSREELEDAQERNQRAPPELEMFPELQLNMLEVPRTVTTTDDRDWRGRAEQPTSEQPQQDGWQNRQSGAAAPSTQGKADDGWNKGGQPAQQGQQRSSAPAQSAPQQQALAPPVNPQALKMQRAEDVGRTAWQKGSTTEGNMRTLKEVKGILNKLTPEKFDTLSAQLIQLVTNEEVLQSTITLIFENAVAQPTFVVVYADLCDRLSKALPESLTGGGKSPSFRSILLNTCQEEFEGAAQARAKLASVPQEDADDAQRRVKSRTLGNIRLIAALFNKGVVSEKIVVLCVEELIGDPKAEPHEDNIEALCELLTKAGKKLEANPKSKQKFQSFFVTLEKWSKSKKLPPRLRFMVKDVIDLRKSSWIPRRDVLQAKKIDEIHAEAHAELGMVPTATLPLFQALPALPASVVGPREEDIELFPAFRGGDAGWEVSGRMKGTFNVGGQEQSSAFFLDFDPLSAPSASAASVSGAPAVAGPAAGAAPAAAATKRAPLKNLSDDDRESRAKSLFSEFVASNDFAEATACVQELTAPGFLKKLILTGIEKMLDLMRPKEQEMLATLLVRLTKEGSVPKEDFVAALHKNTDQLEDLSLDIPVAPKALGNLIGQAVVEGVLELKQLPELLAKVEAAEPKRDLCVSALRHIQDTEGDDKLKKLCEAGNLKAGSFLEADPEIDPSDLPTVEAFLKAEKLESVPV